MSDSKIFQSADFKDSSIPQKMSQTAKESEAGHNLLDIIKSAEKTQLAPAVNALAIEPINIGIGFLNSGSEAGAWVLKKVFGGEVNAPQIHAIENLSVAIAKPGSANYYSQQLFKEAGSIIAVAASGTAIVKAEHAFGELRAIGMGVKEIQASGALASVVTDSKQLHQLLTDSVRKSSVSPISFRNEEFASIADVVSHAGSAESLIGRTHSADQKSLFDVFAASHKMALHDGVAVESKHTFLEPTFVKIQN